MNKFSMIALLAATAVATPALAQTPADLKNFRTAPDQSMTMPAPKAAPKMDHSSKMEKKSETKTTAHHHHHHKHSEKTVDKTTTTTKTEKKTDTTSK